MDESHYSDNNECGAHDYYDDQPSPRVLLNTCYGILMQSEAHFLGLKIVYGVVRSQEDVTENVDVQ